MQGGCTGRCGENYFRGNKCQCDYECLSHKECCKDYEAVCTTGDSCKGRCGESFKRGRQCHCDIECVKYNQCCPDYEMQCNTEDSSVEEEYRELEVTTPLDLIVTEGAVSGSKPYPYDTAEHFDPIENQVTPLPDVPDSETVPSMIGSPVTDKDRENPQDNSKPEQFSSNISAPYVPPAPTKLLDTQQHSEHFPATTSTKNTTSASEQTDPTTKANTSLSNEPQTNDSFDNPQKPVSESSNQNPQSVFEQEQLSYNASVPTVPPEMDSTRPNSTSSSEQKGTTASQSTSESKPSPAPTDQPSNLDLKPTNPVQSEDKEGPEVNLQTQTEAQLEPSEVTNLGRLDIQNTTSADQSSSANITEAQPETKDTNGILSTEDSPKYPDLIASTPPSEMVSHSPDQAEEEKPTKPKNDSENPQGLQDYQADASRDTNLCSGLPVNGLTTLRNGTIVVFRGHYFWMLDSRRNAGPAHLIRDVWGIPSPIDTAFTRCNCQGKTYIFRGDKYWRFENDVMDAGFPRPISEGFGLGGHVVAALSTPRYRSRREAVLFFKRGGLAQKYTYLNTPACGSTSPAVLVKKRFRKEAVPELGPPITISKTWVGFPPTVTSAVSVPTTGGDGYKYYVFSQ
ncbi:proteoglycan 4-like, partial [Clarias magur]